MFNLNRWCDKKARAIPWPVVQWLIDEATGKARQGYCRADDHTIKLVLSSRTSHSCHFSISPLVHRSSRNRLQPGEASIGTGAFELVTYGFSVHAV